MKTEYLHEEGLTQLRRSIHLAQLLLFRQQANKRLSRYTAFYTSQHEKNLRDGQRQI